MRLIFILLCVLCTQAHAETAEQKAQAVQSARLGILSQERAEITTELTKAINAQPQVADKQEGLKDIKRLQANLEAINAEILHVSKQKPVAVKFVVPPVQQTKAAPVPVLAQATQPAPQEATQSQQVVATEAPQYESWDVFNNFKKGN